VTHDPVLVIGATGTHGGAVTRGLLADGRSVHAVTRDPNTHRARQLQDAGARLVVADIGDIGALTAAMANIPVAYAITTPFQNGAAAEVQQGEAIIEAAVRARLPWLILASVAAADRAPVPHFASKARIEQLLQATTLNWTVIAPSYFYENILGAPEDLAAGRMPLPLPGKVRLDQVGLAELGALVATVIRRRDEHLGMRVEVAGDDPTPEAMALALGARHVETPLAQVSERSPDVAAMYGFLATDGYGIDVGALRSRYPEVPWTRFADWALTIRRSQPAP
jgi:uncharacterized protein YbjT (DUF2867 family)